MKFKLKDLKCYVHKLDKKNKFFIDTVSIKDSPWVIYLTLKDTKPVYDSFKATQTQPDFPNDYWYDIKDFDKLVESIKKYGYKKEFCNNEKFQNEFNGDNWTGGKGVIKISRNKHIGDGHHRCAILYYLYGPEYEINLDGNVLQDIEPIN